MELYCRTHLPDKVKELFLEEDDPIITSQDFSQEVYEKLKEEIPDIIDEQVVAGRMMVIASDNVAILVTRKTGWICNIDTKMRKGTSLRELKQSYIKMLDILREKTKYKKMESRTPLEKFARVFAKLTGSEIEGVCRKSFMSSTGEMVDEYIVGNILERGTPCQS